MLKEKLNFKLLLGGYHIVFLGWQGGELGWSHVTEQVGMGYEH